MQQIKSIEFFPVVGKKLDGVFSHAKKTVKFTAWFRMLFRFDFPVAQLRPT